MKQFIRTINGIKYKGKAFEKEDVLEKLGRSEEEFQLIEKYQKTFPQLLIDDTDDFVIDGEQLCNELGIKDNFNTWLLGETRYDKKGNIKWQGKLVKYRCVEGKDYIKNNALDFPKASQHGGNNRNIITLKLECAKKIAMRQNNEYGDIVADYFILMEKSLKDYESWTQIREPEKKSYLEMDKAINEWGIRNEIPNVDRYLQKRECNLLNKSLVGMTSSEVQDALRLKDKIIRDHFMENINLALTHLQELNTMLLDADMKFSDREIYIKKICDNKYPHIKEEFRKIAENVNNKTTIME